jgi:pyruvate-formate lyase-activating enzyme
MPVKETAIMNWHMTDVCNFDCFYCGYHEKGKTDAVHVDKVVSCLKATGKDWRVNLVGGEVMMIPDFLSTCVKLIDAGMKISFETNLSLTNRLTEFVENIDPKKVDTIYISSHFTEREKRNSVKQFFEDISFLKRKGFSIHVNYVLHPSLMSRFYADRELCVQHGVDVKPVPFHGLYRSKRYPEAYTTKERQWMLDANRDASTYTGIVTRGLFCRAGMDYVVMDRNGTIRRCQGSKKIFGSVNDGFKLFNNASVCELKSCTCGNWGYQLLVDRDAAEQVAKNFSNQSFSEKIFSSGTGDFIVRANSSFKYRLKVAYENIFRKLHAD